MQKFNLKNKKILDIKKGWQIPKYGEKKKVFETLKLSSQNIFTKVPQSLFVEA